MKTIRFNLSVIVVLLGIGLTILSSCSKEEETKQKEYPTLKDGPCFTYELSYIYTPMKGGGDTLQKVREGLYRFKTFARDCIIDTILLYRGSSAVYMSRYRYRTELNPNDTNGNAWSQLFEMDFRNAHLVSPDSIVAIYYNTHYYIGSQRKAVPDSGIFIIKILP